MARPKKNPRYDSEKLIEELVKAVAEEYLNPTKEWADKEGHMQLKILGEQFSMTPIKIRKLLITAGVYESPISVEVNRLHKEGKTAKEIQIKTGLSAASVSGYLPYQKTVYKLDEITVLAERLRRYRTRKKAVCELKETLLCENMDEIEKKTWETLVVFAGYPFKTAKGLPYQYEIHGNEILFSRKQKSVTRATVRMTLENIRMLQKNGEYISGPKKLGCFGASYLYPVLSRIGVIEDDND